MYENKYLLVQWIDKQTPRFKYHILLPVRPSWSWSYGSWIYKYLCNQCLSPLMLWVRISIRACVAYIWLLFKYAFICIPNTGRHIRIYKVVGDFLWFDPGTPVSSTNKTDRHDNNWNTSIVESGVKQTMNFLFMFY